MKRVIIVAAFATGACAGPQLGGPGQQQFAGQEGMFVEECVIVPGGAGGIAGDSIAKGAVLAEMCEERFVPATGTPAPLVAFGSGDSDRDTALPDPSGTPGPRPDPGDTDPDEPDPDEPEKPEKPGEPGEPDRPGKPDEPRDPDCPCPGGGDDTGKDDKGNDDRADDGGKKGYDRDAAIRPRGLTTA